MSTAIEWTNETWNPVRGCSRVSPGCEHCYAEAVAARFSGPGLPYEGLARRAPNGEPRWTGTVRLVPEKLDQPLRWKRPRRIFVNSMSDLFHEKLSDAEIVQVLTIVKMAPQHTFQVLTKRAARLHDFGTRIPCLTKRLSNLWLGVSVENQETADERIPHLLATPAAVRFLSVEPLLEAIDLRAYLPPNGAPLIHQMIIGGESGPKARPCDVWWIRSLVEDCGSAGIACFVKQLGAYPTEALTDLGPMNGAPLRLRLKDRKGGDMAEWPEDLRIREYPEARP